MNCTVLHCPILIISLIQEVSCSMYPLLHSDDTVPPSYSFDYLPLFIHAFIHHRYMFGPNLNVTHFEMYVKRTLMYLYIEILQTHSPAILNSVLVTKGAITIVLHCIEIRSDLKCIYRQVNLVIHYLSCLFGSL